MKEEETNNQIRYTIQIKYRKQTLTLHMVVQLVGQLASQVEDLFVSDPALLKVHA